MSNTVRSSVYQMLEKQYLEQKLELNSIFTLDKEIYTASELAEIHHLNGILEIMLDNQEAKLADPEFKFELGRPYCEDWETTGCFEINLKTNPTKDQLKIITRDILLDFANYIKFDISVQIMNGSGNFDDILFYTVVELIQKLNLAHEAQMLVDDYMMATFGLNRDVMRFARTKVAVV